MARNKIDYTVRGGGEITSYYPEAGFSEIISCGDDKTLKIFLGHQEVLDAINTPNAELRNRTPLNQVIQAY